MAYAERRERKKGVRYRGIHKAADGRYRSAGTFSTEEQALAVALEAERHAAEVAGGAAGGLDLGTRATRTIKEYAPLFLRHHQVEGNTKDTYADTLRLHVMPFLGGCRLAETDRTIYEKAIPFWPGAAIVEMHWVYQSRNITREELPLEAQLAMLDLDAQARIERVLRETLAKEQA